MLCFIVQSVYLYFHCTCIYLYLSIILILHSVIPKLNTLIHFIKVPVKFLVIVSNIISRDISNYTVLVVVSIEKYSNS